MTALQRIGPPFKRKSSIGALSAAAVLLLVIAAGSLGWAVWQLRADARSDAFEETGNLALVLAGQLSRFLQTIDVVLAETRDDVLNVEREDVNEWRRFVASQTIQEKLKAKLARLPQAFNIAVADISGQVLASTAGWPATAISIADRDYFRSARGQERDVLAISSPIRNRVNGEVTIVFARSLKDPKGEFIGIVYISVNRKYFEIIYDSIKSVRDLSFILASMDGTVLARYPQQNNDVSGQRMPANSAWYDAIAQGGGSFVTPGVFGGQARLASTRPLQGFPLAVSVSTSLDVAFARWRIQAFVLGLGGSVFVACSLFLLLVAGYEMRSLATSESSLRDKSESLEHSIAGRSEMEERLVQSQKLEAVGQLTEGIAHDFNNLLLVVIGNLDLLKDTIPPGSPELDLIKSSLTAALTGSELSNTLLTFSRQHAFKLETIDPKAIVDDQVRLLKRAMGRKVTLETASSDNIFSVTADAAQLRCALTNLVVNARDSMPEGGAIMVRMYNTTLTKQDAAIADGLAPGDYAVVEVVDAGGGISPEHLSRIFDPFFTTKEVGYGTGLGLSMVYGFVKEMKGDIKVTSEVGKGTTFTLFFPRAAQLREIAAPALAPADDLAPVRKHKTILVVDDDDLVRKTVTTQMNSLGYSTIEASGPAQALEIVAGTESFDLLFSDIVMPGPIDGVELAHLAHEQRPDLKIMLSSGFPDLKSGRCSEYPEVPWQILKKPYRRSDLQRALQGILGEDEPHQAQLAAVAS
jgi:signal transduction histidine kinase/ActR/RegA family two-component response regulator